MKIANIMNDKPIFACSLGEFCDCIAEKLAALTANDDDAPRKKNLVYGLAGIAKLFGCSISTAARLKKAGVLAPAISQSGKIIVVDADLALDLMKVRKRCR